ncbi:hypothetical protein BN8_05656 [Fibrisoma limi BUZ 3]|uniref:MORN variant repeat protein n=2 Tax=Fibrisoma limi TaxID=663275 RepID=I2GR01_9BACT|nr:hypothetical protein BN8_05656 [Fibrisoma limi BUZ 3]
MFVSVFKIKAIPVLLSVVLVTKVFGQTTQPASLTTASKPVLEPSGAPAPPFSSVPSSLTTLGLPSMQSLGLEKSSGDGSALGSVQDLGLKLKEFKKKRSEKKSKKKLLKTEYEGLPMVKAYTKFGSGDRTVVEEFYVLRNNDQKPMPYVKDVYRYYQKSGRVTNAVPRDQGEGLLLHGPYKRFQNGELIEEGFYYVGMKDGRWERYDAKFMLIDKSRWYRGIPADSRVTYHDSAHKNVKEIIPIEYGKVQGTYMAFHENGLLSEEGKYENGVKVGRWTEYYPTNQVGRRRRKLTQYARDQWDTEFEPYVITEWDEKGKVIYERPKEKVVEEEETDN